MRAPILEMEVIRPQWPVPPRVRAAFTLRGGGVSVRPYDSLNLGEHTGDEPRAVAQNRQRIREGLGLPAEPSWLKQLHGARTVVLEPGAVREPAAAAPEADAATTRCAAVVCAVLVADCLPVLLAARDGSVIAAAHAGWRGLAAGVLESAVAAMGPAPAGLVAWLGPGIGPGHFEVGEEVLAAFTATDAMARGAFSRNARGRWQCDLAGLARRRLQALGVTGIYGGEWCTFADPARFFSYRRDGRCGRMAALIWLD